MTRRAMEHFKVAWQRRMDHLKCTLSFKLRHLRLDEGALIFGKNARPKMNNELNVMELKKLILIRFVYSAGLSYIS